MLWGITTTEAGLIHTSTLIASAMGGWVAAFSPTASAACAPCN
jgi:hypothetical protein